MLRFLPMQNKTVRSIISPLSRCLLTSMLVSEGLQIAVSLTLLRLAPSLFRTPDPYSFARGTASWHLHLCLDNTMSLLVNKGCPLL